MSNSEINEETVPYYVQCSIEGCSEWVQLPSLTQHEDNCTYLKKKCTHCNDQFRVRDMENHIKNDCNGIIVNCEYAEYGCAVKLNKKQMKKHVENNIAEHLKIVTSNIKDIKCKDKDCKVEEFISYLGNAFYQNFASIEVDLPEYLEKTFSNIYLLIFVLLITVFPVMIGEWSTFAKIWRLLCAFIAFLFRKKGAHWWKKALFVAIAFIFLNLHGWDYTMFVASLMLLA